MTDGNGAAAGNPGPATSAQPTTENTVRANEAAQPGEEPPAYELEDAESMVKGTLMERMGVEILSADVNRMVGRMPVDGNVQPHGLLHGGASCVLAETLGSVGAALHAGPTGKAVGVEINATHHRSATEGYVTGVATPIHLGRSLATYEIVITDEQERRLCSARLTCMIRGR